MPSLAKLRRQKIEEKQKKMERTKKAVKDSKKIASEKKKSTPKCDFVDDEKSPLDNNSIDKIPKVTKNMDIDLDGFFRDLAKTSEF